MTGQEALELIDRLLQISNQQGLNDLQSAIILAVWEGETYQIVADRLSYEVDYIKQVSARLWKQIAPIVGEDVCKRNLQSVLRRYQNTHVVPSYNRMNNWGETIAVAHFYERLSRCLEDVASLWDSLEQEFQRLSPLQQQVMYWFAINRQGIVPSDLQEKMLPKLSLEKLLEILEALHERSSIEITETVLSQQPATMEYVTEHFIQSIEREIVEANSKIQKIVIS
jgi:hypothetical protein